MHMFFPDYGLNVGIGNVHGTKATTWHYDWVLNDRMVGIRYDVIGAEVMRLNGNNMILIGQMLFL